MTNLKITERVAKELGTTISMIKVPFEVSEDGLDDMHLFLVQAGYIAITPGLFFDLKINIAHYPWKYNGMTCIVSTQGLSTVEDLKKWFYVRDCISGDIL